MSVQRLIRRNSVYYFRCVIPRRISAVLNRKEIRFSLKTASFGEAKRKLVCVNLLIEDYFIKIRQKIHINKYSSNFTMRDIMKFNTNKALALADEYASQTKGDKRLSSEEMLKKSHSKKCQLLITVPFATSKCTPWEFIQEQPITPYYRMAMSLNLSSNNADGVVQMINAAT